MASIKSVHQILAGSAVYSSEAMTAFFEPQSVAVIGASEKFGSVGGAVLRNLLAKPFGGTIYPVNNKRKSCLGIAVGAPLSFSVRRFLCGTVAGLMVLLRSVLRRAPRLPVSPSALISR